MPKLRQEFTKIPESYLFAKIAAKKERSPRKTLINLGVGDVTKPLVPSCLEAFANGVQEFKTTKTFRGYPPQQGYRFLRDAIAEHEYENIISADEIFIGAGAKNGAADLLDLFSPGSVVGIQNPSYPVYVGASSLAGMQLQLLPCLEENNFLPKLPKTPLDILYLCSPNNPTGQALQQEDLKAWVDYAKAHGTIILYDGAYEGFITSGAPRSIYDIPGAKEVAIELRSFSKKGGFTNLRCSYLVIPKECSCEKVPLLPLWKKRNDIKFGGVSYPIQKAAAALYSPKGKKELLLQMQEYHAQALYLRKGLLNLGFTIFGGTDAPYVWCKTPKGISSWEFFDHLLEKAGVIAIPGQGFGEAGEGFIRFSTFPSIPILEQALTAIEREVLCAT